MSFSENLNLLMNITNTTNSLLARNISLDPSFISRLRRGTRRPAKNENYIEAMALYFARSCRAEYQKAALCQALNIPSAKEPSDVEKISELISEWLSEQTAPETQAIGNFVDSLAQFKFMKAPKAQASNASNINESIKPVSGVFYGIEGKQNAVIAFLSIVLKNKNPQTLLLFSDEDMGWLTENPNFTAKWAALLYQVILAGNKIKIIHTINRTLDEMLSAIRQWMPMYMTGAIEPYYYPRTRDGLFKRTLFIAPDTAAVTSNSIGNETKNAANFLSTDKDTIGALNKEYNDFLGLCRPLMRIFNLYNKDNFLNILSEFENEVAESIIKTDVPSSITLPINVAQSIHSRVEFNEKDLLLRYQTERILNFKDSLKQHKFTEIITLPDVERIKSGNVMINFTDIITNTGLFYTSEEFICHLHNIIFLLQTSKNYNVYLTQDKKQAEYGYMIHVKEDVGVVVGKTSHPSVIFTINEANMTASFWDYMNVILNNGLKGKDQKQHTIEKLETIVNKLSI